MDKLVIDVLAIEANKLAKRYSIRQTKRILNILMKTAIDCRGERYHKNRPGKDPLEHGLEFYPSFFEALAFLSPDVAFGLFESSEADTLAVRESLIRYLGDPWTPYYTLEELSELNGQFVNYLRANKSSLIAIGYPKTDFAPSKWLFNHFGRLYPVKIPRAVNRYGVPYFAIEGTGLAIERDALGNQVFDYAWTREASFTLEPPVDETPCSYEEAPPVEGFREEDVDLVEECRALVSNLKSAITRLAHEHTQKKLRKPTVRNSLWDESIDLISSQLSATQFKRLSELERRYEDIFMLKSFSDGYSFLKGNPVAAISKSLEAGGIKSVFEHLFFVEKEMEIGKIHQTKTALENLAQRADYTSYYELAGNPRIEEVDEILSRFLSYVDLEKELDSRQNERLASSIQDKFKTPLLVSPQKYDVIRAFAQFVGANEKVGIEIAGHFVESQKPKRKAQVIELPPGSKWENITVKFINGHDVVIECGDLRVESDFKVMGFEDRHKRAPDSQWEILVLLSEHNGEAIWSPHRGARLTKERKQALKKRLMHCFQIDNDPFFPIREIGHYKIRLNLVPL